MNKMFLVTAWVLAGCMLWCAAVGCDSPQPKKQPTTQPARKPPAGKAPDTPTPPAPEAKAPAGWNQVYAADFKDAQKVPEDWTTISGNVSVADGLLLIKADEGVDAQVALKKPKAEGNVRIEVVAGLFPAGTGSVCDLSPFLNSDENGFESGYLLQFGAAENTENRLRRGGEIIDATVNTKPMVTPKKMHTVVAENDGGKIRLTVDGTEVLKFDDTDPIKGAGHGTIGFYTWGNTLKIQKITVWTKP